jgi:hypothetical protein
MKNLYRISVLILTVLLLAVSGLTVRAAPRSVPTNPGTTNMVGWWSMDETSGNRADSHSNGLTLTDNNTVTYEAGKVSNAAVFTAANYEYLNRASSSALQMGTSDITLCTWVKFTSTASSQMIVGKDDITSGTREFKLFISGATLTFYVFDTTTGYDAVAWSSTSTTSTWYFVCGWTEKSASKIYISVNAGTPVSANLTASRNGSGTGVFQIGGHANTYNLSGSIDETVYYKRTLTTDEIAWLYNSGSGRNYCGVADCSTPTATATNTATATATNTATETPTSTATFTATATVPSATFTNTATFTPTGTNTATDTPTATATVPSATFTNTATATETFTPTVTYTPSWPTLTATATPTMNATQWFDRYWTVAESSSPNVSLIAILCIPLMLVPMAVFVLWLVLKKKS